MPKGNYANRIIFRPTAEQVTRLDAIVNCGQYRTKSEVLRRILTIGLDKLEKEIREKK
jgi:Arc/MetJ-type ribon-helix-helix transcriptional regulator